MDNNRTTSITLCYNIYNSYYAMDNNRTTSITLCYNVYNSYYAMKPVTELDNCYFLQLTFKYNTI
jgi:hypothetical protein